MTSNLDFFVRTHFPVPSVRPEDYRLSIDGEVRAARSWTYAELRALPQATVVATLECAGNSRHRFHAPVEGEIIWGDGAVSTASWSGVRLSLLLEKAGVLDGVRELIFDGVDGRPGDERSPPRRFARSLPWDVVREGPDILVAVEMNGEPLPPDHGFPARLLVPGWYAMASVKWLRSIRAVREPFRGHYQAQRYVYLTREEGRTRERPVTRMRVKSVVTSPAQGGKVPGGRPFLAIGKAWSGSGPVRRVEVAVGDAWSDAHLGPSLGPYAWRSWEASVVPPPEGRFRLRVRATDAAGNVQPEIPIDNERQYGHHAIGSVELEAARD